VVRGRPGLRDGELSQPVAPGDPEQVCHGDRVAEGHARGVDAVLQGRPVAHEMEPEAGPLPLGADLRVREPYRRHEIAPGELGEDPRVDLVGLAGQRCESLHLLRVGDLDVPSHELGAVVDKARAFHRPPKRPLPDVG
jgi:hypothetical protein